MNRTGRLGGYQYRIEPDGVYFRREAPPGRQWTRASNFGISIVDDGEVIDGQVWHTFRFELNGVTVDRVLSRKRLWNIQRMATDVLGARAVVFVVRGAQVRIQSALYACWLYPDHAENDGAATTESTLYRNIPDRFETAAGDGRAE
jgi:hypothetical protein